MNEEIIGLNDWLEQRASGCEKTIRENPYLKSSSWPEYYRGLKDLHLKTSFMISSCHFRDPLTEYLDNHRSEYSFSGGTGYCFVFKI